MFKHFRPLLSIPLLAIITLLVVLPHDRAEAIGIMERGGITPTGAMDGPDPTVLAPHSKELGTLKLNPLRFTNRARCALDSNTPTPSLFLIIDGYNAGKLSHSLAKATKQDPAEWSQKGMHAFRLTVTELLARISADLLRGRLPLLPDRVDQRAPKRYRELSKLCKNGEYCAALDGYLTEVWNPGHQAGVRAERQAWASVDSFDPQINFLQATGVEQMGCYYLKKYSPLQAHLRSSMPDLSAVTAIGQAASKPDSLAHCLDPDPALESRYASVQFDLLNLPKDRLVNLPKDKFWNAQGFDFHNSLKIYFSWAWRNLPQLSNYSEPFDYAFRSIPVEESVMLVPNGCASIDQPTCDSNYLSVNSLREFAKAANSSDARRMIPEGPEKDLLKNPFPGVNDDVLDTAKMDSMQKWVQNMREQFTQARGIAKSRFLSAVTHLTLLEEHLEPQRIVEDIRYFLAHPEKDKDKAGRWKNELYYLCSEFTYAHHEDMSIVRKDLELLTKTNFLDGLMTPFTQERGDDFYKYYRAIADEVAPICADLEKQRFWDKDFERHEEGFNSWFLEAIQSQTQPVEREPFYLGEPLLAYTSYEQDWNPNHVICYSGIDCARKSLKAMVDLFAAVSYADALLPLAEKINSPAAFNPYAERTACKVYDPWFKTKAALKMLAIDLANTALFGWNDSPILITGNVRPGEVTSFNKMIKDGRVTFNPKLKRSKIEWGLFADFGSLLGVPCFVSVSQAPSNPAAVYAFEGISFGACKGKDYNEITVQGADDRGYSSHTPKRGSVCAGCYMSLKTVSNLVSKPFTVPGMSTLVPYGWAVKTGVYLLHAGINFYKNMNDPVNVPKKRVVNVGYAMEAYNRFEGKVPKKCVRDLAKGKRCLANPCEENIADYMSDRFGGYVEKIQVESGSRLRYRATVKMTGCSEEHMLYIRNTKFMCHLFGPERVRIESGPESCTK